MPLKTLFTRVRAALSCKNITKLRKSRPNNPDYYFIPDACCGHLLSTIWEEENESLRDSSPAVPSEKENHIFALYQAQEEDAREDPRFSTKIPISTITAEEWRDRHEELLRQLQEMQFELDEADWMRSNGEEELYLADMREREHVQQIQVLVEARGWFGKRKLKRKVKELMDEVWELRTREGLRDWVVESYGKLGV